jgi:hypothetical protein
MHIPLREAKLRPRAQRIVSTTSIVNASGSSSTPGSSSSRSTIRRFGASAPVDDAARSPVVAEQLDGPERCAPGGYECEVRHPVPLPEFGRLGAGRHGRAYTGALRMEVREHVPT